MNRSEFIAVTALILFGAFVLWCYAVMLTTAVIATRPRDR